MVRAAIAWSMYQTASSNLTPLCSELSRVAAAAADDKFIDLDVESDDSDSDDVPPDNDDDDDDDDNNDDADGDDDDDAAADDDDDDE